MGVLKAFIRAAVDGAFTSDRRSGLVDEEWIVTSAAFLAFFRDAIVYVIVFLSIFVLKCV